MAHQPIDWNTLLKLTNGKIKIAKQLLHMFVSELPLSKTAINSAYKRKDWEDMKTQVHKLHGSCCYTAATELKKLSQGLEEVLQAPDSTIDLTHLETILNQLNIEIEQVIYAIEHNSFPTH